MSKSISGLNILITGASGFIGRNLMEALSNEGANIYAIIHKINNLSLTAKKIFYDGTYESISKPLENEKIDIVIHLATYFLSNHKSEHIEPLIDANIKFGAYLLEFVKQKGIKFLINTSTYAEYFDHKEYNPQNLYAATKFAFEALQKYYEQILETHFVTLELTDTYGPGDTRPKFVNLVLDAVQKKEVFNMSKGEQEICYLYIDDAVSAYISCINSLLNNQIAKNSKYSVYSNEVVTLNNLVDHIGEILNCKIETNKGFYPYRLREIMEFKPNYKKLPGWNNIYTLKDGILKIVSNEDKRD